ncbi:DJ-1 family protein [ANME-1 cluster archaeon ex4572_4]|nr:MAG: DJ-1 family protein [ANME-1 cluster archaeon ex4572_4]
MAKAVLFLAAGFEEIEAASVADVLRRGGVEVVVAGLQEQAGAGAVEGGHGIRVVPDTTVGGVEVEDFDAVVLPGGYPGYENLGNDRRVLDAVKSAVEQGKVVAAICGAPTVLAKAGVLKGKRATIFPGMEAWLTAAGAEVRPLSERVVVDGKIVTSQGPWTALEFGVKLVEILVGAKRARELKDELVANF